MLYRRLDFSENMAWGTARRFGQFSNRLCSFTVPFVLILSYNLFLGHDLHVISLVISFRSKHMTVTRESEV